MYEFEGIRWGFTFLRTASHLSQNERYELTYAATEMYLMQEGERKVKGENYEGVLRNTKKIGVVGSLVGMLFEAALETNYGKDWMDFLVSEQTSQLRSTYSQN